MVSSGIFIVWMLQVHCMSSKNGLQVVFMLKSSSLLSFHRKFLTNSNMR